MKNTPTETQLASIPGLYETDHISTQDKIIHAHFYAVSGSVRCFLDSKGCGSG